MKLRFIPELLLAVLSIAISSCSSVTSKQIVGDDPIDAGSIGLVSHWMDSDGVVVSVSFDEKEPGRLRMTSDCKDSELANALCYARQTEDWVFLNMSLEPEEGEERVWIWWVVKVLNEGQDVLLWRPNPESFAKLVRTNKIAGSVVEQKLEHRTVESPDGQKQTVNVMPSIEVTIDDPEGQWVDELVAGKLGMPIDWQDPTLWRRVNAAGQVPVRKRSPNQQESKMPNKAEMATPRKPSD